jgi:hypothetical protein
VPHGEEGRLEVEAGRHNIALSLTEVRPEGQAPVGRRDSRLMCQPLLPILPLRKSAEDIAQTEFPRAKGSASKSERCERGA